MGEIACTFQQMAACGKYRILALPQSEFRLFFDHIERRLARVAKNGKHGTIGEKIDGVIAPFATGYQAAIDAQNLRELAPVEAYFGFASLRPSAPGIRPRGRAVA